MVKCCLPTAEKWNNDTLSNGNVGIKTFTEKENKLIISFLISFSVTGPLACSCLVLWDVLSCLWFSAFWFPWGVRHHFGTLVRLSWPHGLNIIGSNFIFSRGRIWKVYRLTSVLPPFCSFNLVPSPAGVTAVVCSFLCGAPVSPTVLQILVLEFSTRSRFSLKTVLPADSLS